MDSLESVNEQLWLRILKRNIELHLPVAWDLLLGIQTEVKVENTVKLLIAFDADPEPPAAASIPQAQQATIPQSIAHSQSPKSNPLESVLSQLSVPVPGPGRIYWDYTVVLVLLQQQLWAIQLMLPFLHLQGTHRCCPSILFAPAATPATAPGLAPAMPVNGGNSFTSVTEAGQWPNVQHQQPSLFPVLLVNSTTQQFTPPLTSGNQIWNVSPASNVQVSLTTTVCRSSSNCLKSFIRSNVCWSYHNHQLWKLNQHGRRELPVDLFAATYSPYPASDSRVAIWSSSLSRLFFQPPKSANPFDLSEPVQAQHALQHASSLGTPSPAWMTPQSSPYPPALPSQAPPYSSSIPPSNQVGGGFGGDGAAFGAVNMDQQVAGRFSAPPAHSLSLLLEEILLDEK
ncbi:hypothetical protein NC652_039699 [Populus alba x Populus x berolinensis]|nr:hypothetical protein NC652_039699 [Populus alba x Populus x berolinensis]